MSFARRTFPLLISLLSLGAAPAPPPVADVHERLMEWLVLTGPGTAAIPADRFAAFLTRQPGWPLQPRLRWRFQHALAADTDESDLSRLCPLFPLTEVPALLRCAGALPDAAQTARQIWVVTDLSSNDEAALLKMFGGGLTASDQWQRFQALDARHAYAAARRQIERLAADRQPLASAILAQHMASPDADALFSALPAALQSDPALLQARLHMLRRADRLDDALTLWRSAAAPVQLTAPSHGWSVERQALSRALLSDDRKDDALALADDRTLPIDTSDRQDAAFLTGFIALRALGDGSRAADAFTPLCSVKSLSIRARGLYWMAQTAVAVGKSDDAGPFLQAAAALPATFYGQLALAELTHAEGILSGERSDSFTAQLRRALDATPQPMPTRLARQNLVLAATELSGMGDTTNARLFLMELQARSESPEEQKSVADLAEELGISEPDVFAARTVSRQGVTLYPEGYPTLQESAGTRPDGLIVAIIRQESSFNPDVISPAGAVGLLQLLPGAARDVVRRAGAGKLNVSAAALENPHTNLKVGTLYVDQLLDRYQGNPILMLAAYNAGPHRLDQWLAAMPLPPDVSRNDIVDWIERLPYRETRIYIEHIMADMQIYRTLAHHD